MDLHELGAGAYPEFMTHTDEFTQHWSRVPHEAGRGRAGDRAGLARLFHQRVGL